MVTGWARWLAAPAALRWAGFVLACALVGAATSYPGSEMQGPSSVVVAYVMNLGHFVLYGALALGTAGAFGVDPAARPRAAAAVVAWVGLAGWLDEWHQSLQPARDASLWDLGSDLLGATLVLLAAAWSTRPGGLRGRLLPLAGLALAAGAWTLFATLGPDVRPPLP